MSFNMKIGICKICGQPFDADEINDGACLECAPDEAMIESLLPEDGNFQVSRIEGDCI